MADVHLCYYDGLPCSRFIDKLGFSACYTKDLDGTIQFVCSRFIAGSDVAVVEDLVPKGLIPK